MLRYPVLLLDYDGTMAETRPAILRGIQEGLAEMGHAKLDRATLNEHLGRGATLHDFYRGLVAESTDEQADTFVASYRYHYLQADRDETVLFPGVKDTLRALAAQGYDMAVISNKHEPTLVDGIERFGLGTWIRLALGAVEDQPRKPDPAVWTERLQPVLGSAKPEDCLIVGDTSADLGFAQNMGMDACWATYGHGNAEACAAYRPALQIGSFPELLNVLPS